MKTKLYTVLGGRGSQKNFGFGQSSSIHTFLSLIGYTLQANGCPCLISEWMENGSALGYLNQRSDYDVLSVVSWNMQIINDYPFKFPYRL